MKSAMSQHDLTTADVRPQYLSSQVADRLQELIVNQQFRVGERLPAERTLAARLGVSRAVIREALKLLQERGLVSVQSGSGVFVTAMDSSVLARSVGLFVRRGRVSIAEIYEIRWLLEVENVRFATLRATDADVTALESCLERSAALVREPSTFTTLDIEFHMLLARASQNAVMPLLLETITGALEEQCQITETLPGAQANALIHHRRIFAAVKARNVEAAHLAMSDHLRNSWEWLLRGLGNPPDDIGQITFP
jgi:DNA-binding FadR family transcriptional regulator